MAVTGYQINPPIPFGGNFQIKSLSPNSAIRTMGCIRVPITAIRAVIEAKMHPPLLLCAYFDKPAPVVHLRLQALFVSHRPPLGRKGHCNEEQRNKDAQKRL
nr:MAG TPA: hypothetical protein [Caudoviricetes sp.]